MHDLVFESTRTVTPKEFAEFVATREAAGDTGRYELLNGRVVMSPPAGCSPVSLATRSPRPSSSCAAARSSGKAIPQAGHLKNREAERVNVPCEPEMKLASWTG
jgi:hypothetical protein